MLRIEFSRIFFLLIFLFSIGPVEAQDFPTGIIQLPDPQLSGNAPLEEAILHRRSTRSYTADSLSLQEIGQLLWAAQGITDAHRGLRAAPSAGALYPLEVYVVSTKVNELPVGLYHYNPKDHALGIISRENLNPALAKSALSQPTILQAPVVFIITGVYDRTTAKYGERGIRYVHLEAGHAAENICLEATGLKLGIVTAGAFRDNEVSETLNLPKDETPLYLLPVGRKN